MISLIICARSIQISKSLIDNIENTIGVNFEIIVIDNSQNKYSIFEAYNLGILESKYSILCFLHDDVFFRCLNWGKVLIKYFNDIPNLGCIGIAGARYKTKAPSGWWDVPVSEWALHIIQHFKDKSSKLESIGWDGSENYKEVAVIDGVFFATNKVNNLVFDESILGFHGYDLNISLEARKKGLKVVVTKDILLEHYSTGTMNKEWFNAVHEVHKKYCDLLPISFDNGIIRKYYEFNQLHRFIEQAIDAGQFQIALYYWLKFILVKPIAKPHFKIVQKLLQQVKK